MSKNDDYRALAWWECQQLERQGVKATDWERVKVKPTTDLSLISNVDLIGDISIGRLDSSVRQPVGILNARLEDCCIGDDNFIRNAVSIKGAITGDRVSITNVGHIEFEPETLCGVGTAISVLDETGSSPVHIYPGLSAQVAMLAARRPKWAEAHLKPLLDEWIEAHPVRPLIDDDSSIADVKMMTNVSIGREIKIEGASHLANGMVVNNAEMRGRAFAHIGVGVDAENFIIEDGQADGGAFIRNCYIGQGARVDKRFTAHDSLFFANCDCENGEACALFAGPYTVTMHKSTLLIGAVTSFMNAGSGTNQSNHMYKLGPVHWGVMERGVKTSSASYMMWGARIGPFSLVMGSHKNHPDSSVFPFSYLFGDVKGATTVVPGAMLRSCGLLRDELKWPTRDRRGKRKLPLHDRINFEVLNPMTVSLMLDALPLISDLLARPADDDLFLRFKGMKFRAAHLDRAASLYRLAIAKYLHTKIGETGFPEPSGEAPDQWVDLAGQILPRRRMEEAADASSLEEMEQRLSAAYQEFEQDELRWIADRFDDGWRADPQRLRIMAEDFDKMMEEDRQQYRESLDAEQSMLAL